MRNRTTPLIIALALLGGACGGGEMSLTEYVDELDAIYRSAAARYEDLTASPEGKVFLAQGVELYEFTPADVAVGMERLAEIQDEALEAAEALDPPDDIAELHALFWRRLPMEAVAARAATAATWDELSNSTEMQGYRDALAADEVVCHEFQSELDATEARGVFRGNSWIPDELTEIVSFALGCGVYVEDPQSYLRPPPTTAP